MSADKEVIKILSDLKQWIKKGGNSLIQSFHFDKNDVIRSELLPGPISQRRKHKSSMNMCQWFYKDG